MLVDTSVILQDEVAAFGRGGADEADADTERSMVTGGFEKFKTRKRLQRQHRSCPDCEFVIRRFVDEQESESRSMGHRSGVSGWRIVESWLFHQPGFAF